MTVLRNKHNSVSKIKTVQQSNSVPVALYCKNKNIFTKLSVLEAIKFHSNDTKIKTLEIDGEKYFCVIQEVQKHPVSNNILHIDCRIIDKHETKFRTFIPFKFINEDKSPGLKLGGTLVNTRRTIELFVNMPDVPNHIVVDLTGVKNEATLSTAKVKLPNGVHFVHKKHFVFATITSPAKRVTASDAAK